jgi:hypothetical protein
MEWISVEDKMPEPDRLVIVKGGVAVFRKWGVWITMTGRDSGKPIQWDVTHWMPLPEPPEDRWINQGERE